MIYERNAEMTEKGEEREFERIKPSMRKAYERRVKERKELPNYTFDSTLEDLKI